MLTYILIGLLGSAYFSFFFSAILVGVSILIAYTYAYLVDSEIKIKYIVKTFFAVWILNTVAFPILILNGAFFRTDPYPGNMPSTAHLVGIFFLELAFLTLFLYLRYKVNTVKQKESYVYLTKAWDSTYEVTPVTLEEIRTAIQEIQLSDINPAAFWVGIIEEKEYTLEVRSDLSLIGNINSLSNKKTLASARDWKEVEGMYELFLNRRFKELRIKFDQVAKHT